MNWEILVPSVLTEGSILLLVSGTLRTWRGTQPNREVQLIVRGGDGEGRTHRDAPEMEGRQKAGKVHQDRVLNVTKKPRTLHRSR